MWPEMRVLRPQSVRMQCLQEQLLLLAALKGHCSAEATEHRVLERELGSPVRQKLFAPKSH